MAVGVAYFSQTRGERDHSTITIRAGELAIPGEARFAALSTAALVDAAETEDSVVTSVISTGWEYALPSPGGGTFPLPGVAPTAVGAPGLGGVDLRSECFDLGDGE